ncbi:protein kinase family protein [archaeon]|nr:MAG: protein kinase family protein [archaeon]
MDVDSRIEANDKLLGKLLENVEQTSNNLQVTKQAITDIEGEIPQIMDEEQAKTLVQKLKDLRSDKNYLVAKEESLHREIYQLREENISLLRLKAQQHESSKSSNQGENNAGDKLQVILQRGMASFDIDNNVVKYMRKRFPHQTSLIVLEENTGFAIDIYNQTKRLPLDETERSFEQIGYMLSNEVYLNNEALVPCFKGSRAYLIKSLPVNEYERILAFTREAGKHMERPPEQTRLIFYELHLVRDKHYMIMPRLLGNLSEIPTPLSMECCEVLLQNMTSALDFLHASGYVHMDVKPSNILLTETGHFVLADLSSLTRAGEYENNTTTHRYLPRDFPGKHVYNTYTQTYTETAGSIQASNRVDWWMLAMVFADKTGDIFNIIAQEPTKQEVQNMLERALNPEVSRPLLEKMSAIEQA